MKRRSIESKHQQALVNWAWLTPLPPGADVEQGEKVAHYLFAIPNGGARDVVTASILRSEGVKAGVFDLMLPLLRQGYAGLWIELKAPPEPGSRSGRPSAEQLDWQRRMRRAGYRAEICIGWESACAEIESYLGICKPGPTIAQLRGGF